MLSKIGSLVSGIFGGSEESKETEATKAENEKLKQEVEKLKQQKDAKPKIVQKIKIVNKTMGGVLKNKRFALCGRLSKTQKEFEAIIIRNGGNIVNEVDKNTDYMLVGNQIDGLPDNSKANNAQKFNTPILREQWILDVDAKNKWCSVTNNKYKFDSSKNPLKKTKSISGIKRKHADCEESKAKATKEPPKKKAKS